MEKVKIAKNSLLFRLATVYGEKKEYQLHDICSFRIAFLWGIAVAISCTAVLAIMFAVPLGFAFAHIAAGLMHGWVMGFDIAIIIGYTYILFAMCILIYFAVISAAEKLGGMDIIDRYREKRALRKNIPKKETPIRAMYRSWKDRYCTPVEFVD